MLIKNWREVARIAYSVWFAIAALILLHASDLIYTLTGIDTNPNSWTWILTWMLIGVIVSRFIPQPKEHKWKRRGAVLIFFLVLGSCNVPAMAHANSDFDEAAFELISRWEGKENCAYIDIVGVCTIGYGHTERFKRHPELCRPDYCLADETVKALLIHEIEEYRYGLRPSFTRETKLLRLPATREAAYVSLAFNVGIRGAGRSTAVRRLNRGDIEGGCEALTWWRYGTVNGEKRVVRGLVNRRKDEQRMCLKGAVA